jgi:hypothetical protein
MIVDFDAIDNWAPELAAALGQRVADSAGPKLAVAAPRYVEDTRDPLFELAGRDIVIDATLWWLRSRDIAAFHGTRLTDEEVAAVKSDGLVPLRAEERRARLIRALSRHRRWPEVLDLLDAEIEAHGRGEVAGRREGDVHLTLSKAGLIESFNHYLMHGAEFDQHVAHALLGQEGKDLLAGDGRPSVVEAAIPGGLALEAANPHFGIDIIRARGDVPSLVNEFLKAWSYHLAHPGYSSRRLKADCPLVFRDTVPASWIREVHILEE